MAPKYRVSKKTKGSRNAAALTAGTSSSPATAAAVAATALSSLSEPADAPLYFWRESHPTTGWLSQWYACDFTDRDKSTGVVYRTAEQYGT